MSFMRNPLLYLLLLFFDETQEAAAPSSEMTQIQSYQDMDYRDFMDNDAKTISWEKRPDYQMFHPSTPPCEIYASSRKSGSTPPILRYSKQSNNNIKDEHQQMTYEIM